MFLQNCLRVPRYPKISNFGCPVPEITQNTQPQDRPYRNVVGLTPLLYSWGRPSSSWSITISWEVNITVSIEQ